MRLIFRQNSSRKFAILLFSIFMITVLLIYLHGPKYTDQGVNMNTMGTSSSTDPGNPESLPDGVILPGSYAGSTSYYYKTYNLTVDDFHVVWVKYPWILHDSSMIGYYNADFTGKFYDTGLPGANGNFGYMLINPQSQGLTNNTPIYVKITTTPEEGDVYICAQSALDIVFNQSCSFELNVTLPVKLFEVPLDNQTEYYIRLDVPQGCNFDMLIRGDCPTDVWWDEPNNISAVVGQDEEVTFTPLYNVTYSIMVVRRSGEGIAKIAWEPALPSDEIPGYSTIILLPELGALMVLWRITSKKRKYA